jgi:hypothetical protein
VGLDTILNEDSVSHNPISNVVLDGQVMHAMDCDGSVKGVMDGIASHVGFVDVADHVVMDGVPSQIEGLPSVSNLSILNSADRGIVASGGEGHNVDTIHVSFGVGITLNDDISAQQADLSSEFKRLTIVSANNANVIEFHGLQHSDDGVAT